MEAYAILDVALTHGNPRARAAAAAATIGMLGAGASCELVLDLPPVGSSTSATTTTSSAAASSSGMPAGGSASSSSSSSTSCCDCDGDHYEAEGVCGGQDCDDHDALVYPGEPTYYPTPAQNPAIGFDYDCTGTPEPNPTLNVTVNCQAIGLPCTTTNGYLATSPPACGESAPWGTCKQQGIGCVDDVIETALTMTCK